MGERRSIRVYLRAEIDDFKRNMLAAGKTSQKVAKDTDEAFQSNRESIDILSRQTGIVGAAMTAAAGMSIAKFATFDQAMSSVAASTMETADNLGLLRKAAIDAGADTQYSATEAAGAITALAKAGVSTADILSGGLSGALNLAASDQMDVAQAAEITATALNQYGLKGSDAAHVSDLLAAASGKAMGNVTDMAQALKYVGPVAAQMGISIEQTTGTIAYLAQQGVLADQAGTSLRGMLTALTSPSKIASDTMDELGISVYGANGKFIGLDGVAQQLSDSMSGLTDAERDQALGRIFGNEQITTARLLYAGGAKAVDEWTAAVDDAGFASDQAALKTDNLMGDLERLGGSLDTLFIQSGSGANGTLRTLTQGAEDLVNLLGELPQPILTATTVLVGGGGLVLLGIAGMGKLTTTIIETKAAAEVLGISLKGVGRNVIAGGGILAGLSALTFGVEALVGGLDDVTMSADQMQESLMQASGARELEEMFTGIGLGADKVHSLEGAMKRVASPDLLDRVQDVGGTIRGFLSFGKGGDTARSRTLDQLEALGQGLAQMVQAGDAGKAAEQYQILEQAWVDAGGSVEDLKSKIPAYTDALAQQKVEALKTSTALEDLTGQTDASKSAALRYSEAQVAGTATTEDYTDALKELVDAQRDAAGIVLDLSSAQMGWEESLDSITESIKENGLTLDITTEKGRANRAALDEVAKSGWDVIDSMRANGATQDELQAKLATTRDGFIAVAEQMGMSQQDAAALADQLNLIPTAIDVNIAVDAAAAQAALSQLNGTIAAVRAGGASVTDIRYAAQSYTALKNSQKKALGGAIFGPGSETSDEVPAMLSNNEHVWTAREVRGAGGHGAVASLRAAARTGQLVQRYRDGGAVTQSSRYALTGSLAAAPAAAVQVTVAPISAADLASAMAGIQLQLSIEGTGVREVARVETARVVDEQARSLAGSRTTVGVVR